MSSYIEKFRKDEGVLPHVRAAVAAAEASPTRHDVVRGMAWFCHSSQLWAGVTGVSAPKLWSFKSFLLLMMGVSARDNGSFFLEHLFHFLLLA
jgi:hypothetical protein